MHSITIKIFFEIKFILSYVMDSLWVLTKSATAPILRIWPNMGAPPLRNHPPIPSYPHDFWAVPSGIFCIIRYTTCWQHSLHNRGLHQWSERLVMAIYCDDWWLCLTSFIIMYTTTCIQSTTVVWDSDRWMGQLQKPP